MDYPEQEENCVPNFVLFPLLPYVILNLLFVFACRIYGVAPTPKFAIAVFKLQIANQLVKLYAEHQPPLVLQILNSSSWTIF